ncbi:MAG: alpha/beta fold hydrolase [Marinomonas sp.]
MTDSQNDPQMDPQSDPMHDAQVTMESVAGRTLRVARWRWDDESEHLPVLFFNGIGANIEAVAPLAAALNDRPFIMFDMPGIGGSPDPLLPYNSVTMAYTATLLLDRFGADEVDVMGISWGGAMAQHFAIQHPGRTRRVVLAATSMGMIMVPGNPAALSKMANPRRYIDADYMMNHFETLYGGAAAGGENAGGGKEGHTSRLTPPSARGYFYQLLAMMGWTSAPALPFMKKPMLVMMGDDDQIVPLVNGKMITSLAPNAELKVLEGGGHLFLLTHKDESLEAIHEFLDAPDTQERAAA